MAFDLTNRKPFYECKYHEQFDVFLIDMENMPNQKWTVEAIKQYFDVDDKNAQELLFEHSFIHDAEEFDKVALHWGTDLLCSGYMNTCGFSWYLSKLLENRKIELEEDSYFRYLHMLKESKLQLNELITSLCNKKVKCYAHQQEYEYIVKSESTVHFISEYKITKYLHDHNEYFENLGNGCYLRLGYSLGMHNINFTEHNINSFKLYEGKNRYTHIRVGNQNYDKITLDIMNGLLEYNVYPIIRNGQEIANQKDTVIKATELCILLDDNVLCWAEKRKFYDKEVYCIPYDAPYVLPYHNKIIRIVITSNPYSTLLNHFKNKHKLSMNYSNDLSNLKDIITRGCYRCLPRVGWSSIKETLFHLFNNEYTYENLIKAYAMNVTGLSKDSEVLTRDAVYVELCKCLGDKTALYLVNQKCLTEESLKLYKDKIPASLYNVIFKGILFPTKIDAINAIHKASFMAEIIRNHLDDFYKLFIEIVFGEDVIKDGIIDFDKCNNNTIFNKTFLKKVIEEYHIKYNKRMLGYFFIVNDKVDAYISPLDGLIDKDNIQCNKILSVTYDYREESGKGVFLPPVGNVKYDLSKNMFVVEMSKKYSKNEEIKQEIIRIFNLGVLNIKFIHT